MFTRKHYEELAKLINNSDGNEKLDVWVSSKLIPMLLIDNYKFDRNIFLKACYDDKEV